MFGGKKVLTRAQNNMVEEFIDVTKVKKQTAEQYLAKTKWNYQQAINQFYEDNGGKKKRIIVKAIPDAEDIFKKLATQNEKMKTMVLDEDGFSTFLTQYLKIELDNPVIGHILTNIMELPRASMGKIQKQHIYNLFTYAKANSIKQLEKFIPYIEKEITYEKNYKSMYMKLYNIYLIENYTTLDFDVALCLWNAYLKGKMVFYKQFMEFLEQLQEKKPQKVHKDLWRMVYQFAVNVKNLQDYKEEDGWPVILDEFVQTLKQKQNKK